MGKDAENKADTLFTLIIGLVYNVYVSICVTVLSC